MGGTRGGHARVRRLVPLFESNLRTEIRQIVFLSFHLAAFFQRPAFHCFRMYWIGAVFSLPVSRTLARLAGTYGFRHTAVSGLLAGRPYGERINLYCHRRLPSRRAAALPSLCLGEQSLANALGGTA